LTREKFWRYLPPSRHVDDPSKAPERLAQQRRRHVAENPEMTTPSRDPHRLLAGLTRDGVSLELGTLDVCFLAALHMRAEQDGLASFEEEVVFDVFDQVCTLVEPGVDNARKRATHTIQRLRSQRMVARVDATGIVSAGEYALTSLATVIVQSFLEDEQLTRESLALLTGAVISSLGQIRTAAQRAGSEAEWRSEVVAPLRVTIGDLVGGIERRQRGLDGQQEDVQRQIGELLQADWFGAVEQCQALLEAMAGTLQELNAVLLRDSSLIQALLQEIQQAAVTAEATEAEAAAQRVAEQVDRMAAWGASRQQAWSGYYQYVHRFLRDVVRLDPDRALSQRLLDQVRAWPSRPFAMVVASEARIRLLRPVSARGQRPPVGRPRADRERELSTVGVVDRGTDIESLVRAALSEGAADLAGVTQRVLPQLDERERYRGIGRIAAIVATLRTPRSEHERPWVAVSDSIEIEDWAIERVGRPEQVAVR
jgi:chromosome partition protein MukF